ncbi:hypothetical protein R1sor_017306 [Riccia sorocarpa]|uniref:Uncharacterized protein n=1 Tax=Riccia sorocarpa TaxID=122646 RepID=A0ABD3I9T2_9MARC
MPLEDFIKALGRTFYGPPKPDEEMIELIHKLSSTPIRLSSTVSLRSGKCEEEIKVGTHKGTFHCIEEEVEVMRVDGGRGIGLLHASVETSSRYSISKVDESHTGYTIDLKILDGIAPQISLRNFYSPPPHRTTDIPEESLRLLTLWTLLDVGAIYNPEIDRYDHHQRGFDQVFGRGLTTELSSAALVFKLRFHLVGEIDRYEHHQGGFDQVLVRGFTTKLSSAGLIRGFDQVLVRGFTTKPSSAGLVYKGRLEAVRSLLLSSSECM